MLLSVTNAKTSLIAAAAALSIATIPAAPAHAFNDKEKGFLAGVVTSVIVGEVIKRNRRVAAPVPLPAPAPVYVEPRPTYTPVYNSPSHTSIYRTPAAQAFNSYSLAERKAIQRNLRAWGYYHSSIDGSFGPGTYNAVVAYARDEGASGNLKSTSGSFAVYDGLIF
jgi:hypothetical protein